MKNEPQNKSERLGEYLTENYSEFLALREKEKIASDYSFFWKNQKTWSLSHVFPNRQIAKEEWILKYFVPLLKSDMVVCDLGCATGDVDFLISPYVKEVHAFDLSKYMIRSAKQQMKISKSRNIHFKHANAIIQKYSRIYDSFVLSGLLTCIHDDTIASNIIKNVRKYIRGGGMDIYQRYPHHK
jgi:SAM-dependent methyltransferase